MDWYPNEDAALHFASRAPEHPREVPDVSVTVVGRNPAARLRTRWRKAGIEVTAPSATRPYVARRRLHRAARVGGGTRLKIFEALNGKAVV
jgi:hypothetical protein